MPAFKTYMTLCRVSNLPTVWSNVLAALLLCGGYFSLATATTLLVSLSLFYCGGMALNDICDAGIDALQRPSRPIPAGKITHSKALVTTVTLFLLAQGVLLMLPHRVAAVAAGAVLTGIIFLYNRHHKGNPLSVLLMAGCRFMVYMVVSMGVTEKVNSLIVCIALIQFCYIILLSVIARIENSRPYGFSFPLIPLMLAGICLLDGIFVSVMTNSSIWFGAGVAGMMLTMAGQKYVRGD